MKKQSALRKKIAREAALLIYFGEEKEYKQAKMKAAKNLGSRFLPTNREIAEELDRIAWENEGEKRNERLIKLRKKALELMMILEKFKPKLIGSVWRGTTHRNSDIDIAVYCQTPEKVLNVLKKNNLKIVRSEWQSVVKNGEKRKSFHIFLNFNSDIETEIVVKSPEEYEKTEKCEIYGDLITGLNIQQLKEVLDKNPLQRFLPNKS